MLRFNRRLAELKHPDLREARWESAPTWDSVGLAPRETRTHVGARNPMKTHVTRRQFIKNTTAASSLALLPDLTAASSPTAPAEKSFSFLLLGDLHFDRLEHHDMEWVRRDKPNDVRQIENYSRITREVAPALLQTVRETVADLNRTPATPVRFVLQAGDLVEGLCGSESLSVRQNSEAIAFVQEAKLGAPLLFTKGNHDITGPGSVAAYQTVFHPFLTEQARAVNSASLAVKSGSYAVECGSALFAFFDAYEAGVSLGWLEALVARRTAEHLFVVVHPPVVPYGARATWNVFAQARDAARREKLLTLLGDQRALVLGGHIHRFTTLSRRAGRGRFAQLALSSVLSAPSAKPKEVLSGVESYNADQIRVEPNFSPANEAERRAVYDSERPFVDAFDYADLPGYAVVRVAGPRVTVEMFNGTSRELWRTVDLTALARG